MQDNQNEAVSNNSKKLNGFTITSIVMASVGLLINPLGILSLLGIIFSGVGIAKSNNTKDKTWAIIMLAVNIMETVIWALVFAAALAEL